MLPITHGERLAELIHELVGTTYRSGADLGWTPGEDVNAAFTDWLEQTAQPGDELVKQGRMKCRRCVRWHTRARPTQGELHVR